jgi:preprotein translocase subunit SecG
VLTDILVGIEVLASFALILLILLHSGKGGGLSDMFGVGAGATAAGSTVAEKNLDRITVTFVLLFALDAVAIGLRWS